MTHFLHISKIIKRIFPHLDVGHFMAFGRIFTHSFRFGVRIVETSKLARHFINFEKIGYTLLGIEWRRIRRIQNGGRLAYNEICVLR